MPSHKEFYDAINSISVNADTLNLNTDQVETKLDETTGLLTTLSADTALIKNNVSDGVNVAVQNTPTVEIISASFANENGDSIATNKVVPIAHLDEGNSLVRGVSENYPLPITGLTQTAIGMGQTLRVSGEADDGAVAVQIYGANNAPLMLLGSNGNRIDDDGVIPISGSVVVSSGNVEVSGSVGATFSDPNNLISIPIGTEDASPVRGVQLGFVENVTGLNRYRAVGKTYPLPVSNSGATGESTVSTFTSTASATLKASNANRRLLTIFNEGSGNLHVLYGGGTASTTNYSVRVASGDYLEIDKYTGQVTAIFATAGTARVTEIT